MFSRSIIVFPDDTIKSIVDAIDGAGKSILIKMFLFSDPELLNTVIAAKLRGVKVKVMLNPSRRTGEDENEDTRTKLEAAGIEVRDSNPSFIITHEKSMVVDGRIAFVKSLNWETKNFTETRDYAIVTSHPHEVEEIILCFEADWHRKDFDPGEDARLIWCSLNGRSRIARFIDQAKHTLFIQNERFQDMVIIERIVRAASRGVKVHVMACPPHTLKMEKIVEGVGGLRIMDDIGIKIHKLKHLKLHGKMLLADGKPAEAVKSLRAAAQFNPLPEYEWVLADALRAAGCESESATVEAQLRRGGAARLARISNARRIRVNHTTAQASVQAGVDDGESAHPGEIAVSRP